MRRRGRGGVSASKVRELGERPHPAEPWVAPARSPSASAVTHTVTCEAQPRCRSRTFTAAFIASCKAP